jgi:hypothetical protein
VELREQPFLLIIEDINRLGRTGRLAEMIARWGKPGDRLLDPLF